MPSRCEGRLRSRTNPLKPANFVSSFTMAGVSGGAANSAALKRRQALAGKSGFKGLVQNSRVFFIAVFASLGGLLYGYNQGVFSSVLGMYSFKERMKSAVSDPGTKGWLVAILELGAWFGVLCTGQLADRFGRKRTILLAVIVFIIGVIVQTAAFQPSSIFGGRFVTGLGVGSLSMAVPLYNAELAPPEVRGSLVAMQQMSIVTGIMVSFWIDYGTNYIGGTGSTQSEAAWRIPLALQLVPALILGVGVIFMPYSPRWLVAQGRDEEAIKVLCLTRELPEESDLIQIEYLEIKAEVLFEAELEQVRYPQYQDGTLSSRIKLGASKYKSLLTNRTYLVRVGVGSLTMFFQQWTGINAVLYYAPSIFESLGLSGNTISLLATGVVGITMFLTTIPTVIYIDQVGRKPVLVSGAVIMGVCHLIIAILSAKFNNSWPSHTAAGWVACVLVWIFAAAFGYSWGPAAWVLVAEIYPISVRGPGMSVAASSNWMNNFIVGQVTPSMMEHLTYGTFIFFGLFSLMGGAFVYFMVPETKGLTLEEMDLAFGDYSGTAAADRERMADISRRIGLSKYTGEDEPVGTHEKHEAGSDEKRSVEHSG
ncbi:quinate permease [Ceratobasidium theobromae]|uniref:Quinate permease n=1 Tax=Ceratobasidium theobromae TaxID=1582974 RepID=A0A5N5QBZ6_9AGAM|nr:quinate permease [Ceratobasidium theobromae]